MVDVRQSDVIIQRAVTRNFVVNILDGAFFFLGLSFASTVTILPLFVSQLTDSPFLIGLIPALHNMGWLLPQLLTAPLVERLPRKKPYVMLMTLNERLPWLGMALLALFLPRLGAAVALVIFFVLHAWRTFGSGFVATAWQDMIGKVIPGRRLGTFFGLQFGLGGLLGAGGAVAAGYLLEQRAFPMNYVLVFGLCSVAMAVSLFWLALAVEPAVPPTAERPMGRAFYRRLPGILRSNHDYRTFLLYRIFFVLGSMGVGFYTVHAVQTFGMTKVEAGQLTFAMMATQTGAYPFFGWLGDRVGHRRVMEIAALSATLMAVLSWWAPSGAVFYAVFVLLGLSSAAAMVSNLTGIFDFCAPEERPTYIGLTSTIVGIPSGLAPLIGGALAGATAYSTVFGLTIVFCLGSWLALRWGERQRRGRAGPLQPRPEPVEL